MTAKVNSLYTKVCPNGALDLLRQIALFWLLYQGYRLVRGLADDPAGAAVAFEHARHLISIEQTLNVFIEPQVQRWAESVPGLMDACSWLYINAQTTITLGGLVYLYLRHNESFYFVRNMFMVAMGIALVLYVIFPVAPPRLMPEWGFADSVSEFTGIDPNTGASNLLFNPFAAVPSMHVCFALMLAGPMSRMARRRWVSALWLGYPVLVTFVVVATANHWWIDAALGALVALIAWAAATQLVRVQPRAWAFETSRATVA